MRPKLVALCLLFASVAVAQRDNRIVAGVIDSLQSKVLNEQRKLFISVPPGGEDGIYSKRKFPVVYLLDGDAHFLSVTGMLQQLSSVNGNTVCPEMIVVGIVNTDRTRDLTPTRALKGPDGDEMPFMQTSGGGEKFTTFIKNELIPYIDSAYPTEPYRMFVGHSLGGLMVINTLLKHPDMFNAYVAIDPSMWWDNQKLLKESEALLQKQKLDNKSLFIAVANTMGEGMDTAKAMKDTGASTAHIRSIMQFANTLQRNKSNGLQWNWKYYNDDTHSSVPLIAEYDALHTFFKNYPLKMPQSPADTAYFTADYVRKHYEGVSKTFGYKVLPSEPVVNGLGYQFMSMNMLNKAESFFQMNIENYPNSFNVYDSMGDLYNAKGDKKKAMELYKKALSIRDFAGTREKLEKLKGGD